MGWTQTILSSTIGKKALVALTGLGLVGFLVLHLSGNLLVFSGDEGAALNEYAHWLHGLGFFLVLEIGLLALFLTHIGMSLFLTRKNQAARGSSYAVRGTKRSAFAALWASRTMAISGLIILTFLVVHVWDFRLQHEEGQDLFARIVELLSNPLRAALYIVGSALVGWHAAHGLQSSLRSLGINHLKFTPLIQKAGMALAVIFGLGFASIPLWVLFLR